jgi:DNA (cytosine-5)-methyltransferase 1
MINYLSLFSGIGAFESALRNLGVPFNLVGFSEIDKYAVKSYCEIHNVSESLNLGDITKIDEKNLPKVDFITYGFPCQDISLAGKQKGLFNDDGTKTRSGLFFDALRIIEHTKPMVAIAENVKNLAGKKFKEQFEIVLNSLESAGYNNYWKVLNAKDYGIPQNRERVFIVSIRKDVDTGIFEFPEGFPLEKRLKDLLEETVDEKYYLSEKALEKMTLNPDDAGKHFIDIIGHSGTGGQKGWIHTIDGSVGALSATDYKQPKQIAVSPTIDKVMQIGNCRPTRNRANPNQGRIYDTEGLAPYLNQMGGGNREPHIVESKVFVREATKRGYAEAFEGDSINLEQPNSTTRRGRVGHGVAQTLTTSPQQAVVEPPKKLFNIYPNNGQAGNVYDENCCSPCLPGFGGGGGGKEMKIVHDLRIRKLTPKECFRLMGFKDEEFAKAEAVNSNTQLYKQAGNSIVVDVAEELLCMMFDEDGMLFI